MPLPVPHGPQQRRIQRTQFLRVDLQSPRQGPHVDEGRHCDFLEPGLTAALDAAEILVGIVVYLQGGEE